MTHDEQYAENLLSSIWADSAMLFDAKQTFQGENLQTLNEIIEKLLVIQQNSKG